jgi:hypothetical protein
MPRRHRHRTLKGGFLDDLSNTLSGWGSSFSQGASRMWDKTKNATSSLTGSTPSYGTSSYGTSSYGTSSYNTPSYQQAPMHSSSYGGKHSRRRRHMRGGYKDNTPTTGIAANAASFSGPTAKPHNWVGGRTRRRGRKGGKTRRH